MIHEITYSGKIVFDPVDLTNKHQKQSDWKRIAMVFFGSDICDYYAWFIKKRYGVVLNPPIRGPHISFINDAIRDFNFYSNEHITDEEKKEMWETLKAEYNNTHIDVTISCNIQTNGEHWWLRIEHKDRKVFQDIRDKLGLPIPNLGLNEDGILKPLGIHMTIGYAVDGRVEDEDFEEGVKKVGRMNLQNSKYIYNDIIKKL